MRDFAILQALDVIDNSPFWLSAEQLKNLTSQHVVCKHEFQSPFLGLNVLQRMRLALEASAFTRLASQNGLARTCRQGWGCPPANRDFPAEIHRQTADNVGRQKMPPPHRTATRRLHPLADQINQGHSPIARRAWPSQADYA